MVAEAPGASAAAPRRAPWDSVPAHEQLFVLITGANSGIGLATGQRLIDEFLATRSLTAHLVLLPTTRSPAKCRETVKALRAHAATTAQASPRFQARWQDATARIHVLSIVLDLCDLRGVYAVADRLCHGTVSNPGGLEGEYLENVRIPRLDSVICNAGYGGWSGTNWPLAVWTILTQGIIRPTTWPTFKNALPTGILNERPMYDYPPKPLLAEVFTACVFGHYVLAHQLLPLLSRRTSTERPGRIVWASSVEAVRSALDITDIQCFLRPRSYESAKRLIDVLALTTTLPATQPFSSTWLRPRDPTVARELPVAPRVYVTHPSVVTSPLYPVPWFLLWAYELSLLLSRWLGSPWHCVDGYKGAKSAVWITLHEQDALDDMRAERFKWGSSCDRWQTVDVKKTEAEGWGWEGKVEDLASLDVDDEGVVGVFRKSVGRKVGCLDATVESIAEFEELGADCWRQMEELRHRWADEIEVEEA